MNELAAAKDLFDSRPIPGESLYQYYSVEIPVIELGVIYQFKIWQTQSMTMSILVKEDSAILPRIKVGDRLNMKYYSVDLTYPYQNLDTEIRDITRQERGRLKGHYLVNLAIVQGKVRNAARWPYRSDESQIFSFNALLSNV